jgi:glutathione S-transferase
MSALKECRIVGRSSSLFTRMPLIFAEELGVPHVLEPIYDMTAMGAEVYAGNPALKLPILRRDGSQPLFGAQNICRAIAECARGAKRIVWPEDLRDALSRNAQELVWHCSAAQVQLVMGTVVDKLPAESPFFAKARTGLEKSLEWLNDNLPAALDAIPPRDISLFEVSMFCLVEHLQFRPTLPLDSFDGLTRFATEFARRPSAQRTAYRYDRPV